MFLHITLSNLWTREPHLIFVFISVFFYLGGERFHLVPHLVVHGRNGVPNFVLQVSLGDSQEIRVQTRAVLHARQKHFISCTKSLTQEYHMETFLYSETECAPIWNHVQDSMLPPSPYNFILELEPRKVEMLQNKRVLFPLFCISLNIKTWELDSDNTEYYLLLC